MFKFEINENHDVEQVAISGNSQEVIIDIAVEVNTIYNAIRKGNPIAAEHFKTMLTTLFADEDSQKVLFRKMRPEHFEDYLVEFGENNSEDEKPESKESKEKEDEEENYDKILDDFTKGFFKLMELDTDDLEKLFDRALKKGKKVKKDK